MQVKQLYQPKENNLMEIQNDSWIYLKAFQLFTEGYSNKDIKNQLPTLDEKDVAKYIQPSVDIVIDQIQTIISSQSEIVIDEQYKIRKKRVSKQLCGQKRCIFHGKYANQLGQNTVKHFIKVCRYYLTNNLKNYDFQILNKIFRRWLYPGKKNMLAEHSNLLQQQQNHNQYQLLQKKRRQKQALMIEQQILKKRSQMLTIQSEIEQLQSSLRKKQHQNFKPKFCKDQEDSSDSQESISFEKIANKNSKSKNQVIQQKAPIMPLKSILKKESIIEKESKVTKTNGHSKVVSKQKQEKLKNALKNKPLQIKNKRSQIQNQNKIKQKQAESKQKSTKKNVQSYIRMGKMDSDQSLIWKAQQQSFFAQLLKSFSIRDQSNLSTQMIKSFGHKVRFNIHNIRDKKYELYRICRKKSLIDIKRRRIMPEEQYKKFAFHFENIDNKSAYQFQTMFLSQFYFVKMEELPIKTIRELIQLVKKQKVRILTQKYIKKKKMDKEMLTDIPTEEDLLKQNLLEKEIRKHTKHEIVEKPTLQSNQVLKDIKLEERITNSNNNQDSNQKLNNDEDKDSLDQNYVDEQSSSNTNEKSTILKKQYANQNPFKNNLSDF